MIATVTLNPSLDRTVTVEGLIIEEANRWTSFREDPGGKGINVSRVVHELGGETIAYGFIGGAAGETLKRLLRKQGVPFDFTPIKGEVRSNFIITDLKTNRQTRIDAPGPRISREELAELVNTLIHMKKQPDYLVFAGSVPPGIPDDIYYRLIIGTKSYGIKTVLDSDKQWLREGIKAKPDIIKPNVHETEELLGTELKNEASIVKAARALVEQGIGLVAVSRGRHGMIVANSEKVLKIVAPRVRVRSTVGAGDSALAALILRLSQGYSLEESCRWAVAAGTAATLTPGTELCRRQDVEKLLPKVTVQQL